jgi:hypothetical protein
VDLEKDYPVGFRQYFKHGSQEARICRSRLYKRLKSGKTIGAERRQAFKDLLQNLVQWVYSMADKIPFEKILGVILR